MVTDLTSAPLTGILNLLPIGSDAQLVGGQSLAVGSAPREKAAHLLADDAMKIRCGVSPVLDRWRRRRDGGPPETGSRREAVEVYAGLGFGLPDKPANDDHLQGLVAELFWNRLVQERRVCTDGRELVHAHPVKPDPLEPGGDGLVIYRIHGEVLVFRLWEIKKHNAVKPVSATIKRASTQLATRGREYLAKLAGPETIVQGGPLGALYSELVELWLDRDARAGVGVSVGTSSHQAPAGAAAFAAIAEAFPDFREVGQAEGLVIAVPDFPGFATRVRKIVWSGL